MPRADAPPTLDGRTWVITGAGSGMGRALALRMAARGCPVALADWHEEQLEETAAQCAGPVLHRRLDVRDRQGVMAFAADVAQWAPAPIGAVVNNAGVTVAQSVAGASPEDDEWVVDVNFGGVVHGTRAFLPILLDQGSGTIANTSSVFGLIGFPNQSAYCASKHAVRGFTEALRHELRGTGVRATTIHPGGVKTNIVANARYHVDAGGSTDHARAVKEFDRIAQTSPEKAAKTIHEGIQAGKPRIRVGADAVFFDLLVRLAPNRYFDLLERVEALGRRDGHSMRKVRLSRQQGR
ncbi:SDR family oxidoreductase [Conexibacter sp. SYSU D00693]|uniref:SDR family NAD(P)-dependent oxidoreductase n=1 Tax=Conexibacter sp. SYSU D00693 TaxID=2812560 RepID=UPI00196B0E26|nr:SDR family NAD(P)-dependent oxidoreductase [Conexibacter sp. SYSU D00693]